MPSQSSLPADLEALFTIYSDNPPVLLQALMPVLCNHLRTDRIFIQPRNPLTRVCKVLRWRRSEDVPWPDFEGVVPGMWFREERWEEEDPLWAAALALKPSIYITDLESAAAAGLLNIEFEKKHMKHSAFIHGHAHFPPLSEKGVGVGERRFYGSVQPAVFGGSRVWMEGERELMEGILVRIAPSMKVVGEGAPEL